MKQPIVVSRGLGFLPLLFLIFLTLKLTGFIAWSWFLVTLPLWGPLALVALILIVLALVAGCVLFYEARKSK